VNAHDKDEAEIVDQPMTHNGLMCFFNAERECGADCMAYTTEATESKQLSTQQKNCTVLVAVERLGRFMGNVSTDFHKMQADRVRQSQPSPPDPLKRA
jgi:hypothetical protein